MTDPTHGLEHGLTDYGDRDFSLYLRRSFAQSMGYSRSMLARRDRSKWRTVRETDRK